MPPNDFSKTLDKLRIYSPRLNKITDQANRSVLGVEQFLNTECSIGIEASVSDDSGDYSTNYERLEYTRLGQRFRIAVVRRDENGNELYTPWSDCPRDVKLKSFSKLPELLASIAEKVQAELAIAETAEAAVEKIYAALPKVKEAISGSDSEIPF